MLKNCPARPRANLNLACVSFVFIITALICFVWLFRLSLRYCVKSGARLRGIVKWNLRTADCADVTDRGAVAINAVLAEFDAGMFISDRRDLLCHSVIFRVPKRNVSQLVLRLLSCDPRVELADVVRDGCCLFVSANICKTKGTTRRSVTADCFPGSQERPPILLICYLFAATREADCVISSWLLTFAVRP